MVPHKLPRHEWNTCRTRGDETRQNWQFMEPLQCQWTIRESRGLSLFHDLHGSHSGCPLSLLEDFCLGILGSSQTEFQQGDGESRGAAGWLPNTLLGEAAPFVLRAFQPLGRQVQPDYYIFTRYLFLERGVPAPVVSKASSPLCLLLPPHPGLSLVSPYS